MTKSRRFQQVWEKFKDHHRTEGYQLVDIFEIYLPFWQCKQLVVVEKDVELDRFSRIILELLTNEVVSHSEICAFLGVDEDSFVTVQFHFLLKNDLIREVEAGKYEITHQGAAFLENTIKITNIESTDFEYFVTEKSSFLKNELSQDFFDPNFPIDQQLSATRKSNFSGYTVMQTHQIKKSDEAREIPHRQGPTFKSISEQRTDFSAFFNKQFKSKNFYDFADQKIEVHKRSICFYGLRFEKEDNPVDQIWEIRHAPKTVKVFNNSDLEETLSRQVTKYFQDTHNT